MNKKKPTKRERGAVISYADGFDQQLTDAIKAAAKVVSDAKRAYEKAWRESLRLLAEEIGYANPEGAAELIMEDVEQEVCDHTEQQWEKCLTIHACHQHIEWRREELDAEIKALDAKRGRFS